MVDFEATAINTFVLVKAFVEMLLGQPAAFALVYTGLFSVP